MSATVLRYGSYVAGEYSQFCCNRDYTADGTKRCVIWFHGAGNLFPLGPVERYLVSKGIPIMACDLGGADTWGSATVATRVGQAWTEAKSTYGVKTDKYGLWGGSMGTLNALLSLIADPTHVSVCGGALAIVDPEQVRAANAGGYKAAIEAVHGVGTVPSGRRPNQNTSSFVSAAVPTKLWISETDTVGDATLAHSFVAAIGASEASLGSVGHNYNGIDLEAAYAFMGTYLNA